MHVSPTAMGSQISWVQPEGSPERPLSKPPTRLSRELQTASAGDKGELTWPKSTIDWENDDEPADLGNSGGFQMFSRPHLDCCASGIATLLENAPLWAPRIKTWWKSCLEKPWRPSHTVSPSATTRPAIWGAANGDNFLVMNLKIPKFDTGCISLRCFPWICTTQNATVSPRLAWDTARQPHFGAWNYLRQGSVSQLPIPGWST